MVKRSNILYNYDINFHHNQLPIHTKIIYKRRDRTSEVTESPLRGETHRSLIIIIIIIDKTDAGLNGLCIRGITLIYDVINMYNNYSQLLKTALTV